MRGKYVLRKLLVELRTSNVPKAEREQLSCLLGMSLGNDTDWTFYALFFSIVYCFASFFDKNVFAIAGRYWFK